MGVKEQIILLLNSPVQGVRKLYHLGIFINIGVIEIATFSQQIYSQYFSKISIDWCDRRQVANQK